MSTHPERVWPGTEWQTAELDEVGIDRVKLVEAAHYQAELSESSSLDTARSRPSGVSAPTHWLRHIKRPPLSRHSRPYWESQSVKA